MKILYDQSKLGEDNFFAVYYESDWPNRRVDTVLTLGVYEIDEVEQNQKLCVDIVKTNAKRDINGNKKYYIDADSDLAAVDGWQEGPEKP